MRDATTTASIGPAFDTMTLTRPTQRKLVGVWMEQAGYRTVILPQVWAELTYEPDSPRGFTTTLAWQGMARLADAPFHWPTLTDEQNDLSRRIRSRFTEACFPKIPADMIERHSDAIIVSQALALGTDALVTGDIASIDHYEINDLVHRAWGRNAGFVTTVDDALLTAYAGGEGAELLLILALATIAPLGQDWPVESAFEDLQRLRAALLDAGLPNVSERLNTRWEQADDLEAVLERCHALARESSALAFERLRTRWHRQGFVDQPDVAQNSR